MNINVSVRGLIIYLLIIDTFASGWVVLSKGTAMYNADLKAVYYGTVFLTMILLLYYIMQHFQILQLHVLLCVASPFLWFLIRNLHSYTGTHDVMLTEILLVSLVFMADSDLYIDVFKGYKKLIIVMSVVGIICWLIYVLKIGQFYMEYKYYAEFLYNAKYISFKAAYLFKAPGSLRLCGLFNEPGYFGTILGLTLCADGYDMQKKENWILIIAGLLTLSTAFFITSAVYLILRASKNPARIILIFFVAFGLYEYIVNHSFQNETVQFYADKLKIVDGVWLGDNRTTSRMDRLFDDELHSNYRFFGRGTDYVRAIGISGVLSFKTYIVEYGIVGFVVIYGSLTMAALNFIKQNRLSLFYILVFLINIYQRPGVFNTVYFVILFGGLLNLAQKYKSNVNINGNHTVQACVGIINNEQ